MTHNPNQPNPLDAGLDEALLNEALGHDAVANTDALEQKVLALTSPDQLALLDEALAPQATPDKLAERIIAQTTPGTLAITEARPAVLAPIGFSAQWLAIAAAVLLTGGVVLWFVSPLGSETPQPIANQQDNTAPPETFVQIAENPNDEIAQETELFAEATSALESAIQGVSDDRDADPINRDTIWSELDAYDQFLTDIEADFNAFTA